ncbi:MAG TPA: glycosyltransferase family A protein [Verrucomicrobiae bacterium]|nr:glycosyltransferase family A protein [Verrucomicrobiae bacterium]
MKPRFSIVIPTYNREKLVGPAIDSVLAQTFTDYEVIVVDDGSTDGTPEVLRSYGPRIKVLRQENQGPEVARDRGINMAAGEYVALLDSDDLLWPQALATYDRIIDACHSPALILGATCYFQNDEAPRLTEAQPEGIEVWQYDDYLAKQVSVGLYGSNVVAKKSVIEQAGGLRHSTPTTFHMDLLDTMLRIGVYGPCVVVKQPITVAYRNHAANSIRNIEAMANGVFPIIEAERRGQYPGGRARRLARYACIGGVAWCWFKYALAARRLRVAAKYLVYCTPMFVAGAWKKILVRVRGGQTPPVRVS